MSRIYNIYDNETKSSFLVRADSQHQAVRHVVKNRFAVTVASQDDLISLIARGIVVQDATAEPKTLAPEPAPVIELTVAPV